MLTTNTAKKQAKTRQADLEMLRLATDNKDALKSLPADLRSKANKILYIK